MRFIHQRLEFIQAGERHVYHFSARLEGKRASGCHLDMVDAVVGVFAYRSANLFNSVRDRVLYEGREIQREVPISRPGDVDDWPGSQQARTLDQTAFNGSFQLHISIPATVRPHDHKRGETGGQTPRRGVQTHHHLVLIIAGRVGQVNVAINQSRKHRRLAEVNHLGADRNLESVGRTYIHNLVAVDQHNLIGQIGARLGVEHLAGAQGHNLRLR